MTNKVTIAGKCCESGDKLIEDAYLAQPDRRGYHRSFLYRSLWLLDGQQLQSPSEAGNRIC